MEKTIGKAFVKIFDLLRLDKQDIFTIYFYTILAGILALSLPLGIQTIIGFVMAGSISTSIIVLITLVLLGTFFNGLFQVRQLQMIEKIEQKLFVRYALEYGNRLPKLNVEKLDSYYLPELVNRFFDISGLQKSLHKLLVDIPSAIIQVVLGTILLAFYHPLFIGFGFLLFVVVGIILKFTSAAGFTTSMESSDNKYKVAAWLEEIGRSIKSFKYAKASNLHLEKTDQLVNKYLTARTSHFKVLKVQYWSLIAFKILITACMLILGVSLLLSQEINIGEFIAADIVIISIMGSVEKLIGNMDQIYEALTSVEKLNKVATAEIETSGNQILSEKKGGVSLEFENVDFKYESQNETLSGINFKLMPGEWMQLTGKSGSGKSTILRLITGAFKNFSGKILVDNLPIKSYNSQSIRNQTGIFLSQQDIFLGTLKENLTMGSTSIDTNEILQIAQLTGLLSFIQTNDQGLNTLIDPIGKRLPAEVRHSILLTRAILGENRLLLLEEPFKYMADLDKERFIQSLKNSNATVLFASESKEDGKYCDQVIKLENGKSNGIIFK